MAFYRIQPPLNRQNLVDSCWAACLDSFSRVTRGVPRLREPDLIRSYACNAQGALDANGLARLTQMLAGHGVRVDLTASLLLPYDIEDKLRRSHVILIKHEGGTDWHAWLVYGIDNWILYMDPRDGQLHRFYWARLTSARGFYLIWRP